ncbi:MAG: hypothetical protein HC846_00680 [Blastocatellia bacterium]|nr:hypothetical protein [Blastocatellia bacterium]
MKKFYIIFTIALILIGLAACQKTATDTPTVTPSSLSGIPSLRLNFRFENDVPAPTVNNQTAPAEEKNNAVQADFDQNRPEETLERTISSPDKKRLLAVYQKVGDGQATFRLDMYSADGKLVRKITPNGLAVHYPDTIVWSPDSNNVAFVGMIRLGQPTATPLPDAPIPPNLEDPNVNANANVDTNSANVDANTNTNTAPTVEQPKQVLTFRTEQIYICNSDGGDLKPLTQNEGFIYFYFVWSPDSSALISLATTWKEWQYMQYQADQRGEVFVPVGRPRLVEKTGRIRLLDDNLTAVRPVWSPDSAKVALAYDKDIRIYDAIGDTPTQAAVPLRNQLLISSKNYDEEMKRKEGSAANTNTNSNSNVKANANVNANSNTNVALPQDVNTLPDESTVISFLPIVQLEWSEEKILYLQTGFVRDFKDSTQNTRSNYALASAFIESAGC